MKASDDVEEFADLYAEGGSVTGPLPLENAVVMSAILMALAEDSDPKRAAEMSWFYTSYLGLLAEVVRLRRAAGETTSYSTTKAQALVTKVINAMNSAAAANALGAAKPTNGTVKEPS